MTNHSGRDSGNESSRSSRSEVVSGRSPEAFGPGDLALVSAWTGLVVGFLELASLLAKGWIVGEVTNDTLHINHHFTWMIPVSDFALFGALGLVLAPLGRLDRGPWASRVAITAIAFLGSFALLLTVPRVHQVALLVLAAGLASRVAPRVIKRRAGAIRFVRGSLPPLTVGLLALIGWRWGAVAHGEVRALGSLPRAAADAPNVLLVVLDTVRADALTPYGSARDTTPNLNRLAASGVRFVEARSTAPWTLPSHASLFTGRWPHEHSAHVGRPLDGTHPTLAEALASRGYAAAGFVANTHNCNAWYGLDRGFARYEDLYENTTVTPVEILRSSELGRRMLFSKWGNRLVKAVCTPPRYIYRKDAAMINRDALAWLDVRGKRPFFLFLNYYDAHDPYELPPGAPREFARAGAIAKPLRSPVEVARDAYDDCLAHLDDQIGRLLAELRRRGELDRTLVVITSDHGEAFGEHRLAGHGTSLYRMELRVPLLFAHPGRIPAGRTVDAPVSLRDIPTTVLDLIGQSSAVHFPGTSLAQHWRPGVGTLSGDAVLSEVDRGKKMPPTLPHAPARLGPMHSVLSQGRQYIRNGDGSEELYDLASDPDEHRDLVRSPDSNSRDDLARARAELRRLTTQGEEPRPRLGRVDSP